MRILKIGGEMVLKEVGTAEMDRVARSVIQQAGELIRDRIGTFPFRDVQEKGPSDYVTEVDKACEDLIVGTIHDRFPGHHIMSEETAGGTLQPGITWVIDPLDGTTNFIHGFPFVAVSIAVCLDGKPILGYVLDAVRGELFTAAKGNGAWLNGRPIRVRNVARTGDALVATGFPFRSREVLEPYLNVFREVFRNSMGIRRAGAAALDLAYLASGRVDGFWEVGLKTWDVAAGSLLVLEAGGTVSDFWGTEDYLLNGHIIGGASVVYPFLLEQVGKLLAPALDSGQAGIR